MVMRIFTFIFIFTTMFAQVNWLHAETPPDEGSVKMEQEVLNQDAEDINTGTLDTLTGLLELESNNPVEEEPSTNEDPFAVPDDNPFATTTDTSVATTTEDPFAVPPTENPFDVTTDDSVATTTEDEETAPEGPVAVDVDTHPVLKDIEIPGSHPLLNDDDWGVFDNGGGTFQAQYKDGQGRVIEEINFRVEDGAPVLLGRQTWDYVDSGSKQVINRIYNAFDQLTNEYIDGWIGGDDDGYYGESLGSTAYTYLPNGGALQTKIVKDKDGNIILEAEWHAPPNDSHMEHEITRNEFGVQISEKWWWPNGNLKEEKTWRPDTSLQYHNTYDEDGRIIQQVHDNIPPAAGAPVPGMPVPPQPVATANNYTYDPSTGNLLTVEVIHVFDDGAGGLIQVVVARDEYHYNGPNGQKSLVQHYGVVQFEDLPQARLDVLNEEEYIYDASGKPAQIITSQHYYHWKTGAWLGMQAIQIDTVDQDGNPVAGGTEFPEVIVPDGAEKPAEQPLPAFDSDLVYDTTTDVDLDVDVEVTGLS